MAASYGAGELTEPGLERGAIGLTEVLFQSITHMAPAVATALSIGFATTLAGGITPARGGLRARSRPCSRPTRSASSRSHLPSAGGMYTYVSRGLGSFVGWLDGLGLHARRADRARRPVRRVRLFGAAFITEITGFENDMPVAAAGGPVRPGRLVPHLPRNHRVDADRRRARVDRDRDLPGRRRPARRECRQPGRHRGLHPGQRRLPAGLPGHGLLPARLRRVRGGRAAGRGDPGAEAHDPARGDPVGAPDRPVLHLLLLRGDRVLRAGQDAGRLPRRSPMPTRGAAWPRRCCPGSAACW